MIPLLLRALLGIQLVAAASEVVLGSQKGNGTVPSVAGCKTSCGDLTFSYPFGIGARCSRGPEFALTCNESAQPPILLFRDGITQVTSNIVIATYGGVGVQHVGINMHSTIPPVSYGVNVYNMSWTSPGNSFVLSFLRLNVTGCGFDIYFTNLDINMTSLCCTLICPTSGDITDMVARQNCNGTGCCPIVWKTNIRAFNLKFVRHRESNRSSLWDYYINMTRWYGHLSWNIADQPSCASAKNNTNFACVGNNSRCIDTQDWQYFGYSCSCNPGYVGNPFLFDGCSRDTGINSILYSLLIPTLL